MLLTGGAFYPFAAEIYIFIFSDLIALHLNIASASS